MLVSHPLPESGVLACSGSNPLQAAGMQRMWDEDWLLVWLDVDPQDILARLAGMKVDRIVGQATSSLASVLPTRLASYQRWHHLRVLAGQGWSIKALLVEVVVAVDRWKEGREGGLTSTRAHGTHSLDTALLGGLAPCGGLYLPTSLPPPLTCDQLSRFLGAAYTEVSSFVLARLLHPMEVPPHVVGKMVTSAYSTFEDPGVVPVRQLEEEIHLAELFHGPTGSFKDLALQLTPQLVARALAAGDGGRSLVLVATSGDTGSAVLEGFGKFGGSDLAVIVLYPTKGISEVQRQQMVTCKAPNVRVMAVTGDFDDCQRLVKEMFKEQELVTFLKSQHGVVLNTANSINWGRLVPQVAYHFHVYLRMVEQGRVAMGEEVDLVVPCGNMGNMVSALLARSMGVPYGRMTIASNSNNVLADFFTSGRYDLQGRQLLRTISPAIDILVSSNLERWLTLQLGQARVTELYGQLAKDRAFQLTEEELELVRPPHLKTDWCSEEDCKAEITASFASSGYLLDPHTAVAVAVGRRVRTAAPQVVLATAHYSKFWEDLEALVPGGREAVERPAPHAGVAACLERQVVHTRVIQPTHSILIAKIKEFAAEVFS